MKLTSLNNILWILSFFILPILSTKNIIQIQYKEILPIYCGATYFMHHNTIDSLDTNLRLIATHPETNFQHFQISSNTQFSNNLITNTKMQHYQTIIDFTRENQNDISFKLICESSEWIIEGEVGISSQSENTFISNFKYSILTLSLNQIETTFLKRTQGFIYSANNCKVDITINETTYSGKSGYIVYPEQLPESNDDVIEIIVNVKEYINDEFPQNSKCTVFLEQYSLEYDNLTYVIPANISTQYIPPGIECTLNSKMNMIISTRFIQPSSAYVEINVPLDKEQNFFIRPNGLPFNVSGKNNLAFPLQKMGDMHSLLQFIPFNIKNDTQDDFDYSFIIHGSNNFPDFIKGNEYHRLLLFGNNYYNVYTLIKNKNVKGKIIVSAEQGIVKTCVRIVPLNINDDDSYTGDHINYKKICERNTFVFENNEFSYDINEQHLTQCDEGCAIYIALEFININTNDPYFLLPVDVAIIINETQSTSVSFNQYVYGMLDTNDKFSYYNIKVPYDMNSLSFIVNGQDVEMFINYGDIHPTRENFLFNLTSNSSLTITCNDINPPLSNFIESVFTIGIITTNINKKINFNFAVYPQFNNSFILNLFDSNQYGYCKDTDSYEGACYFITPWHSAGNYSSTILKLYDRDYNIINDNTKITAKLVNKTIFSNLSYLDNLSDIINPNILNSDSELFQGNNVLSIYNAPTNIINIFSVSYHGIIDKYLIIKVEKSPGQFYLFHQTNEHITYNYITSNYVYKTYRFDNSFGPVSFKMNSTKRYYFQLESGYSNLNGFPFCSSFIPYEQYVNFTEANNSPITINIKQYNPLPPKKFEINSKEPVEIIDRHNGIGCYVEVPEQGRVRVNIKMKVDHFNDNIKPLERDLFEVRAFLVNDDFITKRIEDDSLLPNTNEITDIHIFENENTIIFETNVESNNNIVFFVIKMESTNTKTYCSLNPIVDIRLISENTCVIPIDVDRYYMEHINTSIMNKLIYKLSTNNSSMIIFEFAEKGYQKVLDFTIETANNNSEYKNNTSIKISSTNYFGKTQVKCIINGLDPETILLTIFNKNTKFKSKEFFIKYSYNQIKYDLLDSNIVKVNHNKKDNNIYLTLSSFLEDVTQTKYTIKLFKKKDVFRRNVLNSYFENDNETEIIPFFDETIEYSQKENEQSQTLMINTSNLTANHYLTILGIFGNNNEIINKISIKPIEIKFDNSFPMSIIIVIFVLLLLSLSAMIVILRFYIKKNLNKKSTLVFKVDETEEEEEN